MDEIDIPEAIRENIELPSKSRFPRALLLGLGVLLCLGLAGVLSMFFWFPSHKTTISTPAVKQPGTSVNPKSSVPPKPKSATSDPPNAPKAKVAKENLLGHLPYDLAPISSLEAITTDGRLLMRSAAAQKFKQMQADAQAEGISLLPLSAFRDLKTQEKLFFEVKEQRVQAATKRAEVSAPPGYSEHHTGYAIDIGDGDAPATNLEPEFAQTPAFKWLEANAPKYSFELSFPANNEQGVSYEPWHWRFVGDRHSLETFYKVRN